MSTAMSDQREMNNDDTQVQEVALGEIDDDIEPKVWLIKRSSGKMQECKIVSGNGYTAEVTFTDENGLWKKSAPILLLMWWTDRDQYFVNLGDGRWIRKIGTIHNSCSMELCRIIQGWYYIRESTDEIGMIYVRELLKLIHSGVLPRDFANAHLDRRVASGDDEDLAVTFRSPTMSEWLATIPLSVMP